MNDRSVISIIGMTFFSPKKKKSSHNCSVRPRLPIKMFFPFCSTSGLFRPVWCGFYMGHRLGTFVINFPPVARRGHYHHASRLLFVFAILSFISVGQHCGITSHPRTLWPVCELCFYLEKSAKIDRFFTYKLSIIKLYYLFAVRV